MRIVIVIVLALLSSLVSTSGYAQRPDSVAKADSAAPADSIAREDSIRLVREIERIRGETRRPPEMTPTPAVQGPANPTLLPNISAIGDIVADLSPDGSTQESGRRFDVREVELALQAAVDPYFRGDFILGLSDEEGIAIEEAYLSTLSLPWDLMIRAGRFHLPFGKQNTTHRAELHTIEYPHVIQRFLGAEGGKGTGLWLSKIFAPFGFYQELQLTAVESFPEGHEEEGEAGFPAEPFEPANEELSGLGYSARLRNYWDISQASNVEISLSSATGRRAEPFGCPLLSGEFFPCPGAEGETGINVRQSLLGADLTFRWRPLQQGLYKSFIAQAELMRQLNDDEVALPPGTPPFAEFLGPTSDVTGAYVFARYQLTRRLFLGARWDWLENSEADDANFVAVSGYIQFFPSEFSKIVLGYEHLRPDGAERANRLLVQSTIAIGPHRPHPF